MALAEKGDNSTVDAYFRSLRDDNDDKKDDFYDDMPGDELTFSFGHAPGKLPSMRMRTLSPACVCSSKAQYMCLQLYWRKIIACVFLHIMLLHRYKTYKSQCVK